MFHEILDTLDEIACSSFVNTPEGSFHTMQEDWKVEIQVMFDELRSKEKVGVHRIITATQLLVQLHETPIYTVRAKQCLSQLALLVSKIRASTHQVLQLKM